MYKRHIKQLNKKITLEELDDQTTGSERDKIGSYVDNRREDLRGAPSVSWFSTTEGPVKKNTIYTGTEKIIYISGYNMYTLSNIYLSGSDNQMFNSPVREYKYFTTTYTNRLSTENAPISGVALTDWVVNSNNSITITIPELRLPGYLDIVLQGPAGYSLLSDSVYTPTGEDMKYLEVVSLTGTGTTATTATTGTGTTATTATTGTGTTATTATTGTGTTATTGSSIV